MCVCVVDNRQWLLLIAVLRLVAGGLWFGGRRVRLVAVVDWCVRRLRSVAVVGGCGRWLCRRVAGDLGWWLCLVLLLVVKLLCGRCWLMDGVWWPVAGC